jgi:hypothetical protein
MREQYFILQRHSEPGKFSLIIVQEVDCLSLKTASQSDGRMTTY